MGDLRERLLPGTTTTYFEKGQKGFAKIEMLILATGGLNLSQVCAVTGLEGSTIQNWVKRGWVANPRGKKYDELHIARILIINALKECIKLEHISLLMRYVNGSTEGKSSGIIRESELFNYLCDALEMMGQAEDLSRSGVETLVETVIRDYEGPTPDARERISKALTVMVFACVCTDVKRRTEAMMSHILGEVKKQKIADFTELAREGGRQSSETREVISPQRADATKPEPLRGLEQYAEANRAGGIQEWAEHEEHEDGSAAQTAVEDELAEQAVHEDDAPAQTGQADIIRGDRKQMKISQADIERMEQRRANLYLAGKKTANAKSGDVTPEREKPEPPRIISDADSFDDTQIISDEPSAPRKTIAQALREWDRKQDEELPKDEEAEAAAPSTESPGAITAAGEPAADDNPDKPQTKPVYFRRG